MKSAAKASTCAGFKSFQVGPWLASTMWLRSVEPAVIATVKNAKNAYFDNDTGRLYLIVPRQPEKDGPEIRVYQARP